MYAPDSELTIILSTDSSDAPPLDPSAQFVPYNVLG
jgi:hypothetical protein